MQDERSQNPRGAATLPPWWAVVLAAAVVLASVQFGGRIVAALARRGVPAPLADGAFLLFSASLFAAVLFAPLWRRHSKEQRVRFIKTGMFLLVVVVTIFTCQSYLEILFYTFGWVPEVRETAAWLLAIITIGSLAQYVAKRIGIDLSSRSHKGA